MTAPRTVPLVCAALLSLLVACSDDAGTPCRYDYHCFSNSCTFGSCDSVLGRALADALLGDDEESEGESAPEPPAAPTPRCEYLSPADCTLAAHCRVECFCGFTRCEERPLSVGPTCRYGAFDCQTPCSPIRTCRSR
jgi:hypothetical protein